MFHEKISLIENPPIENKKSRYLEFNNLKLNCKKANSIPLSIVISFPLCPDV
jgi:hypothetical protein